jgi:hypothetical protein
MVWFAQQQEQPQFGGIFLELSGVLWFDGLKSLGLVSSNNFKKKPNRNGGLISFLGIWFRIYYQNLLFFFKNFPKNHILLTPMKTRRVGQWVYQQIEA